MCNFAHIHQMKNDTNDNGKANKKMNMQRKKLNYHFDQNGPLTNR